MMPDLTCRRLRQRLATIAILALSIGLAVGAPAQRSEAQAITLNWIEWTPPAAYPNNATGPSYAYTTTALGELLMPDGTLVFVRLTGEIVDPAEGLAGPNCSSYCGPSGFRSRVTDPGVNATVRSAFWQTYPDSGLTPFANDGAAFTSSSLPFDQLPVGGDHIGLIGAAVADGGNPTQRIEFFSDPARTIPFAVRDIVMLIASLGGSGVTATWDFTQDFDILSDNTGARAGSGFTRSVKDPGGTGADFQLSGDEGTGAIQFVGSFTELSWTVSAAEIWASWSMSSSSVPTPRGADPTEPTEPATPVAASNLTLDCTPDPVQPGSPVTCDVSGGDAGITILWRALLDGAFTEQGVTLDEGGRGSFTFIAPVDARDRTVTVELVEWGVTDTVDVGSSVPIRVSAGEGAAATTVTMRVGLLGLVGLLLAGLAANLTPAERHLGATTSSPSASAASRRRVS
jgi:hypothetical protein